MSVVKKQIIINQSENSFEIGINSLIEDLNDKYNLFNKVLKQNEDKWKKITEDKRNISYIPESIRYKSPICLFEGDWGIGKTKFWETLISKTIVNEKWLKEKSVFQKIFTIDLWSYLNSNNMVDEIISDCYNNILPNKIKKKRYWTNLFKRFMKFGLPIFSWLLNNLTGNHFNNLVDNGTEFISQTINHRLDKKLLKDINNYFKKMDPVIIVFENLERLEFKSYKIINLIQKLSILPNLLIIISANKEKIKTCFIQSKDGEHWLDKYFTLGCEFQFKQTYHQILMNHGLDYRESIYLDDFIRDGKYIYEKQLKKPEISIRELNKWFQSNPKFKQKMREWFDISNFHGTYFLTRNLKLKNYDNSVKLLFNEKINDFENYKNDIWLEIKNILDEKRQNNLIIINDIEQKLLFWDNNIQRHINIISSFLNFRLNFEHNIFYYLLDNRIIFLNEENSILYLIIYLYTYFLRDKLDNKLLSHFSEYLFSELIIQKTNIKNINISNIINIDEITNYINNNHLLNEWIKGLLSLLGQIYEFRNIIKEKLNSFKTFQNKDHKFLLDNLFEQNDILLQKYNISINYYSILEFKPVEKEMLYNKIIETLRKNVN